LTGWLLGVQAAPAEVMGPPVELVPVGGGKREQQQQQQTERVRLDNTVTETWCGYRAAKVKGSR
jgi:hypothetical protein